MGWLLVHHAEETNKVPYRYFKKITGNFFINGEPAGVCSETHYVRPSLINLQQDNTTLNRELENRDFVLMPINTYIPFKSARSRDVVRTALQLLRHDTFHFIKNSDDAKKWVKHDRKNEILRYR